MVEKKDTKLDKFKRSLPYRLDLDGVREYFKSTKKLERSIWFCVTVLFYFCAVYFSFLTVQRFRLGIKVTVVEYAPPSNYIFFPPYITLCHSVFWNKTYLEEAIQIPDEIFERAKKLSLNSKPQLLSEFANYISYYQLFHFDDVANIREDVWDLMTELYGRVFTEVQFSDIVADAAIRSNIMERCWYKNRPYKCDRSVSFSVDGPNCHAILIRDGRRELIYEDDSFERAVANFEISLPTKHIFQENDTAKGNIHNLGLTLFFVPDPTPFTPQWATPSNTHAHIVFYHKEQLLRTDCRQGGENTIPIDPEFQWPQTYEACLGKIFEMAAKNICGCHFIAGSYYPRNELVCTPDKIRKCVHTKVEKSISEDAEMFYQLKRQCRRNCWTDDVIATVTYHNLENVSSDRIRNLVTIRPNLEQGFYAMETDLHHMYELFSQVGGVVVVYTGLSIAAFVRVSALLIGAGLILINRNILKAMLGKTFETPLSVRWNVMSIMAYQRMNLGNLCKRRADSVNR